MQGTISFHPIRVDIFDRLIEPLVAGETVNPEEYLETALAHRETSWRARTVIAALEQILEEAKPPPPPSEGTMWEKVKARLEVFDHKVDPLARRVMTHVDPDLHLRGRPFFITEGSANRVATVIEDYLDAADGQAAELLALEQLSRLDATLGKQVEPDDSQQISPKMSCRADLLSSLKSIHSIAEAARRGEKWSNGAQDPESAINVLIRELPYRAMFIHSRAVPFWIAEDVDGLETVCRSAGVSPPDVLVSARPLFVRSCDAFPDLGESLHVELEQPCDVGAFVAPGDMPELVDFLTTQGGHIIQVASRHGVGNVCENVLRKIKECAAYACRHRMGYLEASGIPPLP
jgi:hypothetical protein